MAIIPIGSLKNDYRNLSFGENSENSTVENKPKTEMSTQTKVILGTTLAALAATGIYIATRGKGGVKLQSMEQTANEAIEKIHSGIYKKSNIAGKNVQETINNVLGENSGILPHTYDISKEFPAIHVYRDFGGYRDGLVTKDGILQQIDEYPKLLVKATSNSPDKNGNVPEVKNKIVKLVLNDLRAASDRPTDYNITFISPNQNYTPLQKDVLKLIQNKDKIDLEVFDKICAFNNLYDENRKLVSNWAELNGKYANLDYDLILSAIQSMAKRIV